MPDDDRKLRGTEIADTHAPKRGDARLAGVCCSPATSGVARQNLAATNAINDDDRPRIVPLHNFKTAQNNAAITSKWFNE